MGDLFDYDDDGQVSPEEEAMAFLMLMDDEDDEAEEEHTGITSNGGCLTAFLLIIGATIATVVLSFLA